jgi:polyisoprenoid-binding protein YceI
MRRVTILLFALLSAAGAYPQTARWEIDPFHSRIDFTIRHMVVSKAKGTFHKFSGVASGNPSDPASAHIEVRIDPASIDTDNPDRDADLRSANFFDVARFPTIEFTSTRIGRSPDGAVTMTGNLTMHGVTKEVAVAAKVLPGDAGRVRASATARLDRKDFGITWNKRLDNGGVALSDEVNIEIAVEFVRK